MKAILKKNIKVKIGNEWVPVPAETMLDVVEPQFIPEHVWADKKPWMDRSKAIAKRSCFGWMIALGEWEILEAEEIDIPPFVGYNVNN